MNKFWVLLCVVFFTFSCKSKKAVTSKKSKTKTERVVKKVESKPNDSKTLKELPVVTKVYASATEKYIDDYKDIAKTEMQLYYIPASITLAQGILESGSGNGRLATEANNHFGIKCHDWTGDKIYHDDDAAQECFRKYIDAKYSFRDHSLFLSERKRYANLFKLKKGDYKAWARGLKAAGYATDKRYPEKLISLIERYKLHEFDKEVLKRTYKNTEDYFDDSEEVATEKEEQYIPDASIHIVDKGETLYGISKLYNLSVEALQKLNNLSGTSINVGQELKVKKSNANQVAVTLEKAEKQPIKQLKHIVEKGETLYSISKKYNTSIETIQNLNNLNDTNLSIGQELVIK